MRSSNQTILHIPKTRLKSKGDRAFSVVAPGLWNPFPVHNNLPHLWRSDKSEQDLIVFVWMYVIAYIVLIMLESTLVNGS